MQVTQSPDKKYGVELDADQELLISEIGDYHGVPNSKIVKRLIKKSLKRYRPRTIADIDGSPSTV